MKKLFKCCVSLVVVFVMIMACGTVAFAAGNPSNDVNRLYEINEIATTSGDLAEFQGISYSTVKVNFTVDSKSKVKINYAARPVASNSNFYSYVEVYSADSGSKVPVWYKYNVTDISNVFTTSTLPAGNYYLILGTSETGTNTGFAYSGFIYYA